MPLSKPAEGESFDQEFVGPLIDPDDQENYALGRVNKKTLQPLSKHLHVFDLEYFKADWKDNSLTERSFRCVDLSFFEDDCPRWDGPVAESQLAESQEL